MSLFLVQVQLLKLVQFRSWLDDRAFPLPIYHDKGSLILRKVLRDSWEQCKDADVLLESPSAMAGVHIAEALRE